MGYKFLKHVERTKLLIHCLPADSVDPKKDYQTIRQELANYSTALEKKPEIIVITKTDLVDAATVKKIVKSVKAKLAVSVIDSDSIKKLNDLISQQLEL